LLAFCFEGDPSRRVEGVDASRDTRADALDTNHVSVKTQEPIAIVGMAVNMPGAPSVRELWQVLQNGINTVEPVRLSSGFLPTPSVLSRCTFFVSWILFSNYTRRSDTMRCRFLKADSKSRIICRMQTAMAQTQNTPDPS
jgi:hypothetical protein